jgi:hypothetical protein
VVDEASKEEEEWDAVSETASAETIEEEEEEEENPAWEGHDFM